MAAAACRARSWRLAASRRSGGGGGGNSRSRRRGSAGRSTRGSPVRRAASGPAQREQPVAQKAAVFAPAPLGRAISPACAISRRSRSARRSGVSIGARPQLALPQHLGQRPRGCEDLGERRRARAAGSANSGSSPGGSLAKRRLRPGCSSGRARSQGAQRGALAGGIAVEAQHRLGRQPPQFVQLHLGQRRAERRHRGRQTRRGAARSRPCSLR